MKNLILTALVAIVASVLTVQLMPKPSADGTVKHKETAYERVMRTGTLRCGWASWDPLIIIDSNTGELSGIMYDYVEALGKKLNIKVDWSREIGYPSFPVELDRSTIDAYCGGPWPNSNRTKIMDFTQSIYYVPFFAIVRADDTRFDKDISVLNSHKYTIAGTDGETSLVIAAQDFPDAQILAVTQLNEFSTNLVNVATGKADVTLTDLYTFALYEKANPGKLKIVPTQEPLRVWGSGLVTKRGEYELTRMVDLVTNELQQSGTLEAIIKKYEKEPGTFYRAAKPYAQPE